MPQKMPNPEPHGKRPPPPPAPPKRQKGYGVLLFFVLISALCVLLAYWLDVLACESRWERSGMESEFHLLAGCMVKKDGRWLPAGALREVSP